VAANSPARAARKRPGCGDAVEGVVQDRGDDDDGGRGEVGMGGPGDRAVRGRAGVPALLAADEPDLALADAMFDAVAARILTTAPPASDTGPSAVAVTMLTALPDLPALTDAERALMGEWLTRSLRSG